MNNYLFHLGRQPRLARAELSAVLRQKRVQYVPTWSHNVALISTEHELGDLQKLLNKLGGTIKIAELEQPIPIKTTASDAIAQLLLPDEFVRTFSSHGRNKWTYGISLYAQQLTGLDQKKIARQIRNTGLDIKKYLKTRNISSRFVATRGKNTALTSVVVRKNKLLSAENAEIVLFIGEDFVVRGQTRAAQDFEAYAARDYGRPVRDPRTGSLPPKLAQMLINLATIPDEGAVHDPFVGIGTVVQEGLLMGYRATGSDIDEEQVAAAQKNLAWLAKEQNLTLPDPVIWKDDATHIQLANSSLDAIVTEGTLGPPVSKPYNTAQAERVADEIGKTWKQVLQRVHSVLKPGGTIVCTWPLLSTSDGREIGLKILDDIDTLGYRLGTLGANNESSERQLLRYERPDQVVKRQIVRLEKK